MCVFERECVDRVRVEERERILVLSVEKAKLVGWNWRVITVCQKSGQNDVSDKKISRKTTKNQVRGFLVVAAVVAAARGGLAEAV